MANGQHQSPIDIKPEDADFDPDLVTYPLQTNYYREESRTLLNTGHAWQVNMSGSRSCKSIGKLPELDIQKKYRVRNLKFATYLKFTTCENTNKINELW